MFADLPRQFILDPTCVDKGEYIDHGSFGDIYHGAVYPSRFATDDEGREVAIKIDRMDSKKYNAETATKAYIEVLNCFVQLVSSRVMCACSLYCVL